MNSLEISEATSDSTTSRGNVVRLEPLEIVGLRGGDKVIENSWRKRGKEGKGFTGSRIWVVQVP